MTEFVELAYDLPVYWASYLVNGDASGLEPGEKETVEETLSKLDLTSCECVDIKGEPFFSWTSWPPGLGGGDYVTYVFHRYE